MGTGSASSVGCLVRDFVRYSPGSLMWLVLVLVLVLIGLRLRLVVCFLYLFLLGKTVDADSQISSVAYWYCEQNSHA